MLKDAYVLQNADVISCHASKNSQQSLNETKSMLIMINTINLRSMCTRLFFIFIMSSLLTACGGGGGSDSNTATNLVVTPVDPNAPILKGTLVIPTSTKQVAAKLLSANKQQTKQAKECDNVPTGYQPLITAINFLDINEQVVATVVSNECGDFITNENERITHIRATSVGNRDIFINVEVFQQNVAGVVSTISSTAQYQIASIQLSGSDQLAFAVTDTVTNKAIIGMPNSAFSVRINDIPIAITNLKNAIAVDNTASVGLVLDASPSMSVTVEDENGNNINDENNNPYTRLRLSALAAHAYLDNVSAGDETGMVVFDRNVDFINDNAIERLFTLRDANSEVASYTFSADGFTTEPASLRFVVDAYNFYSTLHTQRDFGYDEKHPDSPALQVTSYPWDQGSAIYDAIVEGLNRVALRTNSRKILIAISDGQDSRSSETEQTVINDAVAKGIPVYTIAYGKVPNPVLGGANVETMQNIASATNATFFLAGSLDLAAVFQSIQTGINFQYIAALSNVVAEGDSVELVLDYNGISATRTLQK